MALQRVPVTGATPVDILGMLAKCGNRYAKDLLGTQVDGLIAECADINAAIAALAEGDGTEGPRAILVRLAGLGNNALLSILDATADGDEEQALIDKRQAIFDAVGQIGRYDVGGAIDFLIGAEAAGSLWGLARMGDPRAKEAITRLYCAAAGKGAVDRSEGETEAIQVVNASRREGDPLAIEVAGAAARLLGREEVATALEALTRRFRDDEQANHEAAAQALALVEGLGNDVCRYAPAVPVAVFRALDRVVDHGDPDQREAARAKAIALLAPINDVRRYDPVIQAAVFDELGQAINRGGNRGRQEAARTKAIALLGPITDIRTDPPNLQAAVLDVLLVLLNQYLDSEQRRAALAKVVALLEPIADIHTYDSYVQERIFRALGEAVRNSAPGAREKAIALIQGLEAARVRTAEGVRAVVYREFGHHLTR